MTGGNGWRHNFTFYAFDQQRPRTTVFAVGHANCGKCPSGQGGGREEWDAKEE